MKTAHYHFMVGFAALITSANSVRAERFDTTHVISELQKGHLIAHEVCVSGAVTQVLSKDNSFYIESLEADRDNDPNTSEGLRIYVDKERDRSSLHALGLEAKDIITVCGRHDEFRRIRPVPVLKYSVEIIESNEKVKLSLNQADPITSLIMSKFKKTGTLEELPRNNLSCPSEGEQDWLEPYENMRISLGSVTVIKAGDPLYRNDFRFFAKGEEFNCPVPITLVSGRVAFEPGTVLENLDVIVSEGPFSHELIPINQVKAKKAMERVNQIYPKPAESIRIASYNVKNLEPVKRADATDLCLNSAVVVDADDAIKEWIQQKNDSNSEQPQITLKSEYCALIRSRLGSDKTDRIADQIHSQLGQPEILALQEIQDDDGALPSNILTARKNLQSLTHALNSSPDAKGVKYTSVIGGNNQDSLSPEIANEFGGLPGANIRNAFIIREDFLSRLTEVSLVKLVDDYRFEKINKGNCANSIKDIYQDTRVPIVLKYHLEGERFVVVNVHQSSNFGGETPEKIMARFCQNSVVANYAKALKQLDENIKIVITGDFNDDPASMAFDPLSTLQSHPLPSGGYTFIFNGLAEQLDYFYSLGFEENKIKTTAAHINAQYTNGASDHNPVLFDFKSLKQRAD